MNTPVNVVISNVPGPRQPLYFAGAKLDAYIPVSTISDGVGLNITVHSYGDRMDFGLIADRDLVPDLWHLVDLHIAEIGRLFEATGAEWAVPQPPPPMRKGGDGVGPVAPSSKAVEDRIAADRIITRRASVQPGTSATKRPAAKTPVAKKGVAQKAVARRPVAKRAVGKKSVATKKAVATEKAVAKKAVGTTRRRP